MATYISEVEAIQFTGSNYEECKAWLEENITEEGACLCEDDEGRVSITSKRFDVWLQPENYMISINGKLDVFYPESFIFLFKPKN